MADFSAPSKRVVERLDYRINWARRLKGDEISTSEWSIQGAADIDQEFVDGAWTGVWLQAGLANENNVLVNTITTTGGRVFKRTMSVFVNE